MYYGQILSFIYLLSCNIVSQNLGEITIYNTNNSDLSYNQINCLEFDDNNALWVGTQNGLSILEENGNWVLFDAEIPGSILSSNIITALEWAPKLSPPTMFIGTNAGITAANTSSWENNYGWECNPNNGLINTLCYNNLLWAGSTDGLCVEGMGGEANWLLQNTMTGFYSNNITSIKCDNNSIGIGTMNGGLVTYDGEFNIYYSSNSDILDNTVLDLAFDQNNNIIICTPQAGLGVLTENGNWIWFNTINSTLPTNSLTNVVVDNNNDLWITTLEEGLIHYTNNTFYNYNTNNSNLPDNKINYLTFGPDNHLWLGTETAGIVKIHQPIISTNMELSQNVNIFPTIFNSKINIDIKKNSKIYIFNSKGEVINQYKLNNGFHTIYTDHYNDGIYLIRLESDNHVQNLKLLKLN